MRYHKTFQFFATEEEAKNFCDHRNATASRYCRKKHPAHFTPWQSSDPNDPMHFVAWYYE